MNTIIKLSIKFRKQISWGLSCLVKHLDFEVNHGRIELIVQELKCYQMVVFE